MLNLSRRRSNFANTCPQFFKSMSSIHGMHHQFTAHRLQPHLRRNRNLVHSGAGPRKPSNPPPGFDQFMHNYKLDWAQTRLDNGYCNVPCNTELTLSAQGRANMLNVNVPLQAQMFHLQGGLMMSKSRHICCTCMRSLGMSKSRPSFLFAGE